VYVDTKNLKDRVWAQLKDNPSFTTRFVPVYQSGSVNVYKNINPAGIRS
jgi:hypothetical protein